MMNHRMYLPLGLVLVLANCGGQSDESQGNGSPQANDPIQDTASIEEVNDAEMASAIDYWTPERMQSATMADRPDLPAVHEVAPDVVGPPVTLAEPAAPDSELEQASDIAPDGLPSAKHFDGVPVVGALFHKDVRGKDHFCTASVIASKSKNLIISAAHCLGSIPMFVPQYSRGRVPHGIWSVSHIYRPRGYPNQNLDFAFAKIAPRKSDGKNIQSVVGANGLKHNAGFVNRVTVIGYPDLDPRYDDSNRPVYCSNTTHRFRNDNQQVEFDCNGYFNGTSGSPWILQYDPHTGRGYTNGVIGGFNGGGPNWWTSTTSYFNDDVANLYKIATR